MYKITPGIFAILLFNSPVFAAESYSYLCSNQGKERIISVNYAKKSANTPCEVVYTKDGKKQKMWSAESRENYCEKKAQSFIEQQKAWGWPCQKQISAEN
ncbi:MAG: hypothetical protein V7711_02345 [Pseudomonadales bacterium]